MMFKVADKIRHRSNHELKGVVLRRSAQEQRYYISWLDTGKRRIHTQDFIEEYYEHAEDGD